MYAIQLLLNFAWSPLFFGAKRLGLALLDIAALDVTVLATAQLFWNINPIAGKLFLPYLAWISYATALNAYIYAHNKSEKKE